MWVLGFGVQVAYKLMPQATPTLLAHAESVVGKRAVFASKNLWVSSKAQCNRLATWLAISIARRIVTGFQVSIR
jgi:hypothetical protein